MELRAMTLSECAKFDKDKKLAFLVTGWGNICKLRAKPDSKSQKRKTGKHVWQKQ